MTDHVFDEFIKGFDVSSLAECEKCGAKYFDVNGGEAEDVLKILKRYGGNWVRLRLWNDPYSEDGAPYGAGSCDFKTILGLAKRAKALGFKWLLDFHYSDFWGDPGKQTLPKAWRNKNFRELVEAVETYTYDTVAAFDFEGARPDMVQVGNEITCGILWPFGMLYDAEGNPLTGTASATHWELFEELGSEVFGDSTGAASAWDLLAVLLHAGIRACRRFDPSLSVMLHLDAGGNNPMYRAWFDNYIERAGDNFDAIGLSYYPAWHGPMAALRDNMNDLALRYKKPMVIVEAASGFSLEDYSEFEGLFGVPRKGASVDKKLAEGLEYPMTPEGQICYTKDLIEVLKQVPGNLGKGFMWWEPAWIPVPGSGWAEKAGWEYVGEKGPAGNEFANMALFDYHGKALPALEAIKEA